MKEKDIIKALRAELDDNLGPAGFKFNSKLGGYVKFDKESKLYFEIAFVFMDFVAIGMLHKSKYLEVFLNVYHDELSKTLLETSQRSFLDSLFYFKVIGNLMSDIILNEDYENYTVRNRHDYFKFHFVTEDDLAQKPKDVLAALSKYALPFFEKVNSLEVIKVLLDKKYDKYLPIHNVNNERLLALTALLFHFKCSTAPEKVTLIRNYFVSVNDQDSIVELDRLIKRHDHD